MRLLSHGSVARVQPVIHADDRLLYEANLEFLGPTVRDRLAEPVLGGETRQSSVRNGLEALAGGAAVPSLVLIHDAARPFASAALIERAITAGRRHGAAVPGIPVADTIKLVREDGSVASTPPRGSLRAVQTPQAFGFETLLSAHRAAAEASLEVFTDDAALAEWAGLPVAVVAGEAGNIKLTDAEDFARAGRCFGNGMPRHARRHRLRRARLRAGDHVVLGGVRIPTTGGSSAIRTPMSCCMR